MNNDLEKEFQVEQDKIDALMNLVNNGLTIVEDKTFKENESRIKALQAQIDAIKAENYNMIVNKVGINDCELSSKIVKLRQKNSALVKKQKNEKSTTPIKRLYKTSMIRRIYKLQNLFEKYKAN